MFQNFHAPQHYSPVGHNKVELLVMNNNSDSSRLQPPPPPLRPRKQPLPPGWTEYLDFSSSELYYHNDATRETTWDRPSFHQNNAQPPPPPRRVTTTGTTSSPLPATATNSSFKEVAVSTTTANSTSAVSKATANSISETPITRDEQSSVLVLVEDRNGTIGVLDGTDSSTTKTKSSSTQKEQPSSKKRKAVNGRILKMPKVAKNQRSLFGLRSFGYEMKKIEVKKVGKRQFERTGREYICIDDKTVDETVGKLPFGCNWCSRQFPNAQGLGSHMLWCKAAIHANKEKEKVEKNEIERTHDPLPFIQSKKTLKEHQNQKYREAKSDLRKEGVEAASKAAEAEARAIIIEGKISDTDVNHNNAKNNADGRHVVDGRRNNRGSSIRNSFSARDVVEFIDMVDEAIEDGRANSVTDFFRNVKNANEFEVTKMVAKYTKWSKDEFYSKKLNEIAGAKKCQHGRQRSKKQTKSPFHDIEEELYVAFTERRRKSHRVSGTWIRSTARKIFLERKAAEPDKYRNVNFKASFGWMRRFINRRRIKFRRRKNDKEKTAEECIADFEHFLYKLRFEYLQPRPGDTETDELYGRFPPHLRYNMDQVPLPFVNGQDVTFTVDGDVDVNIKCPKESLRKRQFTMHLVFNAAKGELSNGWCDLVCKGTGKRIKQAEKDLWNDDVDIFWQKKAWVDKLVMREIAEKFVRRKIKKHGANTWVLLFCDNLSAHLDDNVKEIFGKGKVFLCYLPPNMTNFIQPIDAGLGRCVRIAVGNFLDEWLMDDNNMEKWESMMTAPERRILTSELVAKAMDYVMSVEMENMRVSAFKRTGCLITMTPTDACEKEIKLQGIPIGSFSVPTERKEEEGENGQVEQEPEPMDEEIAALADEQHMLEEEEEEDEGTAEMEQENDLFDKGDEEDNGDLIDDNEEDVE